MSAAPPTFDAYHKWLGISAKDQPPNHYRLLGLELFEEDPDVIANAADQRMMLVRSFQAGENYSLSQQLLNEVAAAKLCLLSSPRKLAYDQQLRQDFSIRQSEYAAKPSRPGTSNARPAGDLPAKKSGSHLADRRVPRPLSKRMIWAAVAAATALIAIASSIVLLSSSSPSSTSREQTSTASNGPSPAGTVVVQSPDGLQQSVAAPPTASTTVKVAPLSLQAVPEQKLAAGATLRIPLQVSDTSLPAAKLQFFLGDGAPTGMSINQHNGLLEWAPTNQQRGNRFLVKVHARDGERHARTTFSITTEDQPQPLATLKYKPVSAARGIVGSDLVITPELEPDAHREKPVMFSLLSGPAGARVDSSTGQFTWKPLPECAGQDFEAKIRAALPGGQSTETALTIHVMQTAPSSTSQPEDPQKTNDERTAVPDIAAQTRSAKMVKQVFSDALEKARKGSQERSALAETLLDEAAKTRDDKAGEYALICEAAEQAKTAGDVPLFIASVDALAKSFAVSATDLKQEGLTDLAKEMVRDEAMASKVTQALLDVLAQRIARDQWQQAADIVKVAQLSATKSRDADLRKEVGLRSRECAALSKAHAEQVQALGVLASEPDDTSANHTVGVYEAIVKNQWDAGLPHLAKGSAGNVATVAKSELQKPAAADERQQIADRWAELLHGKGAGADFKRLLDVSPTAREHLRLHALDCYRLALSDATGLAKRAIEQKVADLQTADEAGSRPSKSEFSKIVDDKEATFVGDWLNWSGLSFGPAFRYAQAGKGNCTATYTFAGLAPGRYNVYATWESRPNRGTNVPFTIHHGGTPLSLAVNQQTAPAPDFTAEGRSFKLLGTVKVVGSKLAVIISNQANGYVVADAVRIERK